MDNPGYAESHKGENYEVSSSSVYNLGSDDFICELLILSFLIVFIVEN